MTADKTVGQVQLDPTGRLAQDIHCIHCGYNLRSLLPDQACPECGRPVEPSLRGDMLCFSSPAWLAKLAWGTVWLILGWVQWLVFYVLQFVWRPLLQQQLAVGTMAVSVQQVLCYSMDAAEFVGIWMVTCRDPRRLDERSPLDPRVLARILLVAKCILQHVAWRAALPWHPAPLSIGSTILWLIPCPIWLLGYICLYVHLARLARRIPATGLVWLTYAGIAAISIGSCVNVGHGLWQTSNAAAGRWVYVPLWGSILIDWFLPLAYMVLLLAAQILYRMQFRRALRQSRQGMQEANAQPGTSG